MAFGRLRDRVVADDLQFVERRRACAAPAPSSSCRPRRSPRSSGLLLSAGDGVLPIWLLRPLAALLHLPFEGRVATASEWRGGVISSVVTAPRSRFAPAVDPRPRRRGCSSERSASEHQLQRPDSPDLPDRRAHRRVVPLALRPGRHQHSLRAGNARDRGLQHAQLRRVDRIVGEVDREQPGLDLFEIGATGRSPSSPRSDRAGCWRRPSWRVRAS